MSGKTKWRICWSKVTGAMHIKKHMPCQDAIVAHYIAGESLICVVADGHGSQKCPYSEEGAKLATQIASSLIRDLAKKHTTRQIYALLKHIDQIQLPRMLEQKWKEAVCAQHLKMGRKPLEGRSLYELYGTTLMLMYITPSFIFATQIGDGDMICIDEEGNVQYVIEAPVTYGVETHSLCENQCWRHFKTICKPITNPFKERLFMVSTDGYANSFVTKEDFYKAGRDYLSLIKSNEVYKLREALPNWLEETSQLGSGDDITLALIYQRGGN